MEEPELKNILDRCEVYIKPFDNGTDRQYIIEVRETSLSGAMQEGTVTTKHMKKLNAKEIVELIEQGMKFKTLSEAERIKKELSE